MRDTETIEVQRGLVRIFREELHSGWAYPCTTSDIAEVIGGIPEGHLDRLWAVGLNPSTKNDSWANARYLDGERPTIHIFSYPVSFRYKLAAHTKRSEIERVLGIDLEFGMQLESVGRRWWAVWEPTDLRRFILHYVLPHEIGHHVLHTRRIADGLSACPSGGVCEQFADAYARRYLRERRRPERLSHRGRMNTCVT